MSFFSPVRVYFSRRSCLLTMMMISLLISSCVTTKKTTYLQEYEDSPYEDRHDAPSDYLIQPNDNLFIRVTTPDPRNSEMFNTFPSGGGMSMDEQAADIISYQVELDGNVILPYVGPVQVAGMTVSEARIAVSEVLNEFLTDAAITVKLVNNYVSVLGEVARPGRYPIYKGQLNIFQALAMSGDIISYGDRYKINIIRQSADGTITKEFDLTDKQIIDTEYFYVMPNDVIYVQPMKGKFMGFEQFPFMIILTSVTTFILVLNYIQQP